MKIEEKIMLNCQMATGTVPTVLWKKNRWLLETYHPFLVQEQVQVRDAIKAWGINTDIEFYPRLNEGIFIQIRQMQPTVTVDICFENGCRFGYSDVEQRVMIADGTHVWHLHQIEVLEKYRNTGYGSKLLEYTLNLLMNTQQLPVSLVIPINPVTPEDYKRYIKLHNWYHKFGFRGRMIDRLWKSTCTPMSLEKPMPVNAPNPYSVVT